VPGFPPDFTALVLAQDGISVLSWKITFRDPDLHEILETGSTKHGARLVP
jgi:hypothetical protein